MSVSEKDIAEIVADASARMHEPEYISTQVDTFMGAQPVISQYVMSHSDELTVEGVVTVLFNAALIHQCVGRSQGATPGPVDIPDLDAAAQKVTGAEALSETEPELANYIASNIDLGQGKAVDRLAQKVLAQVAQSLIDS